jgi:hypothetical protein
MEHENDGARTPSGPIPAIWQTAFAPEPRAHRLPQVALRRRVDFETVASRPACAALEGLLSRNKGARTERALVRLLQERGFAAEHVPLSGASGGRYSGDISVPVLGDDWRVEVKCRADGFRELYAWLDGNDALIVKGDRQPPLIVLRLDRGADIVRRKEERS